MTGAELTIVFLAITAGATLKSLTGMGLPALSVPIIAFFVGVEEAVVVVALPNFVSNGAIALRERSHWRETRDLPALIVTGAVGAIVGALLFVSIPDRPLIALLLLAVLGFVVSFFARPPVAIGVRRSARWAPVIGTTGGVFHGAIGISGPIIASWILAYRLPKNAQVLSLTTLFLTAGVAQLVVFLFSGTMSGRWLAGLLGCIPALATVPIGGRIRDRIDGRAFDYLAVLAISLAGIGLGWRTFL